MTRKPTKDNVLDRLSDLDDDDAEAHLRRALGDDETTVNITHCPPGSIDADADDGLDGDFLEVPRESIAPDDADDASDSGVETNLYEAVPLDDDGEPILDDVLDPQVRKRAKELARERAQDDADDAGGAE